MSPISALCGVLGAMAAANALLLVGISARRRSRWRSDGAVAFTVHLGALFGMALVLLLFATHTTGGELLWSALIGLGLADVVTGALTRRIRRVA